MRYLFFICLALLFSCSLKNEKQQRNTDASKISRCETVELKFAQRLSFRRTFANIQFIDDEKEQDEYIAKQEKTNPLLIFSSDNDSSFLIKLEVLGIVKGEEL